MQQHAASARLLFTGDVFCDVVFSGAPAPKAGAEVFAKKFLVTPGGTANRAVAAARLGVPTILITDFGDDVLGTHIRSLLIKEPNLDLTHTRSVPGYQSPVTVSLTGAHDRSFITYEEGREECGPSLPDGLPPIRATHVGLSKKLPTWVSELRQGGTTVVGGVGWDSTGSWSREVLDRLGEVDVFVPNELEAMNYTHTDDAIAAVRALGEYVELAVVTRGPKGAVAYDSGTGELTEVSTTPVPVVDPTGAGDVFVASFMSVLDVGWRMEQRLRFAALCASLSTMSLGGAASAPTPEALIRFLSRVRPEGDWTYVKKWVSERTHPVTASHTAKEN